MCTLVQLYVYFLYKCVYYTDVQYSMLFGGWIIMQPYCKYLSWLLTDSIHTECFWDNSMFIFSYTCIFSTVSNIFSSEDKNTVVTGVGIGWTKVWEWPTVHWIRWCWYCTIQYKFFIKNDCHCMLVFVQILLILEALHKNINICRYGCMFFTSVCNLTMNVYKCNSLYLVNTASVISFIQFSHIINNQAWCVLTKSRRLVDQ